jgi:Flavodoxin-like fold
MKVLTVYAHHDPRSFCHSVLDRFTEGLANAGIPAVGDLRAIKFDPVFKARDLASYIDAEIPASVQAEMDLAARLMDGARGPVQRWLRVERCVTRRPKRSPRSFDAICQRTLARSKGRSAQRTA